MDSIKPWITLDIPLELTNTRYTFIQTGSLPGRTDLRSFEEKLKDEFPESALVTVKSEEDLHYAVIFGMKTDESDIMEFLRGWEWNRITFREGKGTAYERTEKLKVSLKRLEKEREHKRLLLMSWLQREKIWRLFRCVPG